MSPKDTAYIVERLAFRFMSMVADYERKLVEHRDSFGVRTSADAKIIEGMRADVEDLRNRLNSLGIQAAKQAGVALGMIEGEGLVVAAQRVVKERDGLLTQVQDQRAEIERLTRQMAEYDVSTVGVVNERNEAWERCDALRAEVAQHRKEHDGDQQAIVGLLSERDKLRAEVAALKHEVDTLSCPYVSGQRVRVKSEGGLITQQSEYGIGKIGIINAFAFVAKMGSRGWVDVQDIEPCDLPVDHDTPAGKEAAESAAEIKVGDVVEVVSASGGQTWMADVGSTGKVRRFGLINSIECVLLQNLPGKRNALGGYVSLCDVRKVPQ